MTSDGRRKWIETVANDERVAKVFIVIGEDARKCLICNRVLSKRESFEHSNTICFPPASVMN
jgi:hypothetical protein